ncbi:MAG: holo-ACP synthase [Synergistaceae bacterium]|nr:holo-ACP synthase [Synergistaceae bacterium]
MIQAVGIDLCSISRIEKALESEHFRDRIFTPEEIAYAESKGRRRFESYAACFAAREAFCKASGVDLMRVMNGEDFAVIHDSEGKPGIRLSEKIKFPYKIFLSLSHEKDLACAIVIVEN